MTPGTARMAWRRRMEARHNTMSVTFPVERDRALMAQAIAEAHAAIDQGCVGVAALLANGDEVLTHGHNRFAETGDRTLHGEMVVLRAVGAQLSAMSEAERGALTLYTTLEPCLMCFAAASFCGLRRIAYAALIEDANDEAQIARGLTCDQLNPLLVNGPMTLVPGVMRAEGRALLSRMGKLREH